MPAEHLKQDRSRSQEIFRNWEETNAWIEHATKEDPQHVEKGLRSWEYGSHCDTT